MSYTDRELIEFAAKAADIFLTPETLSAVFPKWKWDNEYEPVYIEGGCMSGWVVCYSYSGELAGTERIEWDPLEDDGDALRLAVELKLDISFGNSYYFDEGDMTFCGTRWDSRESQTFKRFVKHGNDSYAATRRAIVRAAAEIGRNMK